MVLEEYRAWLVSQGLEASANQYARIAARWLADERALRAKLGDSSLSPSYRHHLKHAVQALGRYLGQDIDIQMRIPAPRSQQADREPLSESDVAKAEMVIKSGVLSESTSATCGIILKRGLRCGDVLRIPRKRIGDALRSGTLSYIGKGRKIHRIDIRHFRGFLETLDRQIWPVEGKVCHLVSPDAGMASAMNSAGRAIRRAMKRIAAIADIDQLKCHPHRFRHTAAHRFLSRVRDRPDALVLLRDWMGHSSVTVTEQYLRADRSAQIQQIEDEIYES